MKKVNRKFNWVSSLDNNNIGELKKLQEEMIGFYSNNKFYYSENDFTSAYWNDNDQILYQDILNELKKSYKILEVGCGSANILSHKIIDLKKYTGVEFSEQLINNNKLRYPEAKFFNILDPYYFPFEENSFDLVFSIFVIEHTVFPPKYLSESLRVLRNNGKLIILCPDFLGKNHLSSQRVGLSSGTGREKLKKGQIVNAILTGFDTKIRMPLKMQLLRIRANKSPKFYINLSPTCFIDPFSPDVDAVYLTYENEILEFLRKKINWFSLSTEQKEFIRKNKLLYLKGVKVKN